MIINKLRERKGEREIGGVNKKNKCRSRVNYLLFASLTGFLAKRKRGKELKRDCTFGAVIT
jgi:hypothetical protein